MTLIEGGWNGALPKICKHSQALLMLMLLVGQATAEMGRERKRESERETKKWTQCHTHIPIENNGCSVGKKNCQSLSQFISALFDTSSSYFSFPKLCKNVLNLDLFRRLKIYSISASNVAWIENSSFSLLSSKSLIDDFAVVECFFALILIRVFLLKMPRSLELWDRNCTQRKIMASAITQV